MQNGVLISFLLETSFIHLPAKRNSIPPKQKVHLPLLLLYQLRKCKVFKENRRYEGFLAFICNAICEPPMWSDLQLTRQRQSLGEASKRVIS